MNGCVWDVMLGDDVFGGTRFVTETRAGMCRGVARPRTRGWREEDKLQERARTKQLTHALLQSLIIIVAC